MSPLPLDRPCRHASRCNGPDAPPAQSLRRLRAERLRIHRSSPPGFVYLACVYGDDDTGFAVEQTQYLAQVGLFTIGDYPDDRVPGGRFLSVQQNQALFQLIGVTYGGNGVIDFVTPDAP